MAIGSFGNFGGFGFKKLYSSQAFGFRKVNSGGGGLGFRKVNSGSVGFRKINQNQFSIQSEYRRQMRSSQFEDLSIISGNLTFALGGSGSTESIYQNILLGAQKYAQDNPESANKYLQTLQAAVTGQTVNTSA